MNNSESGRKLNQAVNTTSKAVGGAILQAKGALSNWWSAMTITQPPIIAQSDTPDPTSTVPTEHTSFQADDDVSSANHADSSSSADKQQQPDGSPTDEIGKTKSFGVVEIGHEAVSALELSAHTTGNVFTV